MNMNLKPKYGQKPRWRGALAVVFMAFAGLAALVVLPMTWKPVAFALWGAATCYALVWIWHGKDYELGWCDGAGDEAAFRDRLAGIKHPRRANGQFRSKGVAR